MTRAAIRYARHVLKSSSLYPLGTLWLAATIVIPLTMIDVLGHGHAVAILLVVAGVLILAANNRDARRETRAEARALRLEVDHVADVLCCQREGLEAYIRALGAALTAAGQPVPPPPEGPDHAHR